MTEQTRRGKKTARYRARGLGFPFLWVEFWSCFSQRRIPDDRYYCLCWVELKWMVVQWIICFILSVPWKVLTCAVHVLLRPLSARWGLEGEIMPLLIPPAHPLITLNHPTCRTQRAGSCWGQPYYVFVIKGLLQSEGYLWQVVTTWFLLLLCSSVGIKVFFFSRVRSHTPRVWFFLLLSYQNEWNRYFDFLGGNGKGRGHWLKKHGSLSQQSSALGFWH